MFEGANSVELNVSLFIIEWRPNGSVPINARRAPRAKHSFDSFKVATDDAGVRMPRPSPSSEHQLKGLLDRGPMITSNDLFSAAKGPGGMAFKS
jgi:hypothetical protein